MFEYFIRRLLTIVPTLVFVSMLIFGLQQLLPGDPAVVLAGEDQDPAVVAYLRTKLHLDEPLPVLIAYGTAIVVQGQVRFFDDVYGYDAVLDRALRQRRLPPLPSPTLP